MNEFSNYDKDYDVISFYTDDILRLNSIINIYPQIYLTNCTYNKSLVQRTYKMLEYHRIDISEGIDFTKSGVNSRECRLC